MDSFEALVEAMGDPIRSQILFALADKPDGTTIRGLAERLGEPPRRVRYHLAALVEQDLVTVAGEAKRRGVVERYYRVAKPPIIWPLEADRVPETQMRKIAMQIFRFILADVREAVAAKTFASQGDAQIRIAGDVDARGWKELATIHERMLKEVEAVLEDARDRLVTNPESPVTAVSVAL
ncbi:MAG TPA: ArsR family transcriptional regulator, partial [Solirubrobacterales bacterium]|nr:ArsR family transcriptional regulator [Solirubrobacterales bacterium]